MRNDLDDIFRKESLPKCSNRKANDTDSYCMMIWFLDEIKNMELEANMVNKMLSKDVLPVNLREAKILQSNVFKIFSQGDKF